MIIIRSIGIIGCGNMGSAIVKSISTKSTGLGANTLLGTSILVYDKIQGKAQNLCGQFHSPHRSCEKQASIEDLIEGSEVIILAVKPQDSSSLFKEMASCIDNSKIIISIMAGVKIKSIERDLGEDLPISRVMPNIAAFVGESASALSYNKAILHAHKAKIREIFQSVGKAFEIDEKMQDAFTAISGSGPAYFFFIVESMVSAAKKHGFSDKQALEIVVQTMKGSAELLELGIKQGDTPESLRKKVTSKGGTTEAAIKTLDEKRVRGIILDAVSAAVKRAKDLS